MFVIRFVSVVVACTLHRRDTRVPVDGEALKLRDARRGCIRAAVYVSTSVRTLFS